jgi:SAM-dependent methyltransferase
MVANQILGILSRSDLSEPVLGLIAEQAGASGVLDSARQHVSTYTSSHWDDLDRSAPGAGPAPVVAIVDRGLERIAGARGPVLDVGCSAGRATFHLAERTGQLAVGVDLSFNMLRVARSALAQRVTYRRRIAGLAYEERSFEVALPGRERVDFWCADALALPFREATFGLAASLNFLDCVASPLDHLRSLGEVVQPGGAVLLSTPFDWAPGATPVEAWIGGRSSRGPSRGEDALRAVLSGDQPSAVLGLRLLDEVRGLEWPLRLHERSTARYVVDLFVLGR